MPIKWVRKALKNLEQAYQFIATDNLDAAVDFVLKIQAATIKLESFPNLGKPGRVEGTRELVIANTPYLLVYRIKGKSINILRLLHTSRRYPE
jgi:toxin ParE1/3/4